MAAAAAAAVLGCGDPAGLVVDRNGGDDEITVGAGVAPTYTWDGGAARRLVVANVGTGTLAWDLRATNLADGFLSPVDHGVTPAGGVVATDAVVLQAGVTYRVTVTRVAGGDISTEFTR